MGIDDYQPATAEVPFNGGSLVVRGLSSDDVAVLMRSHMVDLDKLVGLYQSGVSDNVAVAQVAQYAITLAREAPGLVANIVALACDDGDNVPKYRKLSMPMSMAAVKTVIKLTFEEAGGPKKFAESLMQMVRGIRGDMTTDSLT